MRVQTYTPGKKDEEPHMQSASFSSEAAASQGPRLESQSSELTSEQIKSFERWHTPPRHQAKRCFGRRNSCVTWEFRRWEGFRGVSSKGRGGGGGGGKMAPQTCSGGVADVSKRTNGRGGGVTARCGFVHVGGPQIAGKQGRKPDPGLLVLDASWGEFDYQSLEQARSLSFMWAIQLGIPFSRDLKTYMFTHVP